MPRCSVSVTRSGQHQQQLILSPPSLRRILHGCVSGPDMLSKHACMQVFCDMKLMNTREKILVFFFFLKTEDCFVPNYNVSSAY